MGMIFCRALNTEYGHMEVGEPEPATYPLERRRSRKRLADGGVLFVDMGLYPADSDLTITCEVSRETRDKLSLAFQDNVRSYAYAGRAGVFFVGLFRLDDRWRDKKTDTWTITMILQIESKET